MKHSTSILLVLSLFTALNADGVEADLSGFDDTEVVATATQTTEKDDEMSGFDDGEVAQTATEESAPLIAGFPVPPARPQRRVRRNRPSDRIAGNLAPFP